MSAYTPRELLEALSQPGCPVCRLAQQAVSSYLVHLFYESVNDIDARARLETQPNFSMLFPLMHPVQPARNR